MASLIYLATRDNLRLAGDLVRVGYRVFEAAAVREVLQIWETVEVQLRRITIKLMAEATAKELIWELSLLFPDKKARI